MTTDTSLVPGDPSPPYIECEKCGYQNHIDAALVDERRCVECNGFIRRPTDDEQRQFNEFIKWKTDKMEAAK